MSFDQEYFCPNCGAVLNDQPGFDPDRGTWMCAECGQELMDDDIYYGDTFEGIAWYCDGCGALLNRQNGFSDSYGTWTCTECGHVNGTTSADIIAAFKCPRCGAALDVQSCFNKYDDDWECTECGAHLHHAYSDDEYEEVEEPKYRCPNCGAALDSQGGFSEYQDNCQCAECGAHLHHGYSGDDYIVVKHVCPSCGAALDIQFGFTEWDDDWECTECGAHLHHDCHEQEYTVAENNSNDVEEKKSRNDTDYSAHSNSYEYSSASFLDSDSGRTYQTPLQTTRTVSLTPRIGKRKPNRLHMILLMLLLVGAIGYMGRGFFTVVNEAESHPGEIKLTHSAEYYKDENYYNSTIKLLNQGLSDIRLTPLNDLKDGLFSGDNKKEGKIETIEINGRADFQSGTWVDERSVVSITYHSFAKGKKSGYEPGKNKHLILNGVDIALPTYLVEDIRNELDATYHVKGENETQLTVFFDSNNEWTELSRYRTHYILKQEKRKFSGMSGEEIIALGKTDDEVYLAHVGTFAVDSDPQYLHVVMISPDTSRTDYMTDYEAILSGIYIPKDSEIRIDFSLKDYKGDNYNEVVAELKAKGFQRIRVENLKDVVLGVFAKDGAVESISINGGVDYKVGDWINNQSEVVIAYHGKK